MPLTREQKEAVVEQIAEQLDGHPAIYLTDYQGLSVAQSNELRGRFRKANVQYSVLKNTLLRLAMERLDGFDGAEEQLHGPTAVAFSEEPAAPARVIKDFLEDEEVELPRLKAAFIDGAFYDADQLEALAALKSKDELISDIAGLLMAPITNIASALNAQGSSLASVVQQLSEREEEEG